MKASNKALMVLVAAAALYLIPTIDPALAVTRSCTADRFYVTGTLRQQGGGPTFQVRAYYNLSVSKSESGVAPELTRRRACRDAAAEGLRNFRATVSVSTMQEDLCSRSVIAPSGRNIPLPRGTGVIVNLGATWVETSREPDIHDMGGLPAGDFYCAGPAASSVPPELQNQAHNRRFDNPMLGNYRLDWCEQLGANCGKPAADHFCHNIGYSYASQYEIAADIGASTPTSPIGTPGVICTEPYCDGFSAIWCQYLP